MVYVRESKTRAGIRYVPLTERLREQLQRWRRMTGPEYWNIFRIRFLLSARAIETSTESTEILGARVKTLCNPLHIITIALPTLKQISKQLSFVSAFDASHY